MFEITEMVEKPAKERRRQPLEQTTGRYIHKNPAVRRFYAMSGDQAPGGLPALDPFGPAVHVRPAQLAMSRSTCLKFQGESAMTAAPGPASCAPTSRSSSPGPIRDVK